MKLKIRLTPSWWTHEVRAELRGMAMGLALSGMQWAEVRATLTSLHVVIEPSPECTVATVIAVRDSARAEIEAIGPKAYPFAAGAA